MIKTGLKTFERWLRVGFCAAAVLLLISAAVTAPLLVSSLTVVLLIGLTALGFTGLKNMRGQDVAIKDLYARQMSSAGAIAILLLSFALRNETSRPLGFLDVAAFVAFAYFFWNILHIQQHLRLGTRPAPRETRKAFASRMYGNAVALGGSGSVNEPDKEIPFDRHERR